MRDPKEEEEALDAITKEISQKVNHLKLREQEAKAFHDYNEKRWEEYKATKKACRCVVCRETATGVCSEYQGPARELDPKEGDERPSHRKENQSRSEES